MGDKPATSATLSELLQLGSSKFGFEQIESMHMHVCLLFQGLILIMTGNLV